MAIWQAICVFGLVLVSLSNLAHAHAPGVDHDTDTALCMFDAAASTCSLSPRAVQSHLGFKSASNCTAAGGSLDDMHEMTMRRMLQVNATSNSTIPTEEGGGWECDPSRTAMGCADQKILHTMSNGEMAHYMYVCMPSVMAAPGAAQAWWDAYSSALDCSQQVPPVDCTPQILSQLQVAGGDKNANDATALQTYIVTADSTCRGATTTETCSAAAAMVQRNMTKPTLVGTNSTIANTTTASSNTTVSAAAIVVSTAAAALATFVTLLL